MKTKYLVLLCDGMSDEKIAALDNKTPMEAANKPTMDKLARYSLVGRALNVPLGMSPGSDPANLAVMSYDPSVYSNGRSPLEAASMGLSMTETMTAFRCNILTLSDGDEPYEEKIMIDHGADEITTEEADVLIKAVEEALSGDDYHFYTGVSYRHCLLWENAPEFGKFVPPHDILEQKITNYLPEGEGVDPMYLELMKKSYDILNHHPINEARRERGLRPANSIWLWSPGKKPALPDFGEKWKLKASVISAVDLIKGIAVCANMESIDVEGATGNINTNYEGKANAAIEAYKRGQDYVYVHVEAPDECGHRGEVENKVRSIELIDEKILKPVYEYLKKGKAPFKIMVLPDHPTPIKIRTHSSDPVPFFIYSSESKTAGVKNFNEESALSSGIYVDKGHLLMNLLVDGKLPECNITPSTAKSITDIFELFAISLICVMLVMTFIGRHSPVVGESMQNTLNPEDVLLVTNVINEPESGDIVIIQEPSNPTEPLVKRVIATGGQHLKISYQTWEVFVDGKLLDDSGVKKVVGYMEDYNGNFEPDPETGIWEGDVPEGFVFVMGDNRNNSNDSRKLGFIDNRYIIGKVRCRLFPVEEFKFF